MYKGTLFIFQIIILVFFIFSIPCSAEQTVIAMKTETPPAIDGKADDPAWQNCKEVITHDRVANIDIRLAAVYTKDRIFFLVRFPDGDESRIHKPWVWDKATDMYKSGPGREDAFILKWAMQPDVDDLSIYADRSYSADIWYWKANRTDPAGFADDKYQILSGIQSAKSKIITSRGGQLMYLQRVGDLGSPSYKTAFVIDYAGETLMQFSSKTPSGSRSDVRAKGLWHDGEWIIEFSRALDTQHPDDVGFNVLKKYLFGVSRYEIAGRKPDLTSSQPLHGSGDVTEKLFLGFQPQDGAKPATQ